MPVIEREQRAGEPGALVCADCGSPVTTSAARAERFGAHVHERYNPAGVRFRIGCFRAAPGAVAIGEESDYFTWFAGFAWTAAVCARCGAFLGWRYRGLDAAPFYGLILDRLRDAGPAA